MDKIDQALEEVSKEVAIYKNKENYMQRLIESIPELRFITRPHDLPKELFDRYAKINGYGKIFESEVTDGGYQVDKITDEVLENIIDEYFDSLRERDKELEELKDKLEDVFDNSSDKIE